MIDGTCFDGNKAYKDSKLCNILFARELAARLGAAGLPVTCNTFSPGFIPTSRLFRNQNAVAQMFLGLVFNAPPLATTLPTAGTFMCEMVLGKEKENVTGEYFCGPPDYQPEGEPNFLGFLRGLMYPQFRAKQPSEEAQDAELSRRLWDISETFLEEAFGDLEDETTTEEIRDMEMEMHHHHHHHHRADAADDVIINSAVERLPPRALAGTGTGANSNGGDSPTRRRT